MKKVFLLFLLFLSLFLLVFYLSSQRKITYRSKADEPAQNVHDTTLQDNTLFFAICGKKNDDSPYGSCVDLPLNKGDYFNVPIILNRPTKLDPGKEYAFNLFFIYYTYNLEIKHEGEYNRKDIVNGAHITMGNDFDIQNSDIKEFKDEDKGNNRRLVTIKGYFKSDNSYPQKQITIVDLINFKVKNNASTLDQNNKMTAIFNWVKEGDQKTQIVWDKSFLKGDENVDISIQDGIFGINEAVDQPPAQGTDNPPVGTGQTTNTPTSNQTTQTGFITLNLSLKFQGILKKPDAQYNTMLVKVGIGGGSSASPISSQTGTFTANDAGVWSGSVTFPAITTGSNYRILVKGPKHLQKRICDAIPSESYPGSYSCNDGKMSLQAGVNSFDFSKVYQLAGDLPEQNGVQNGFTNSYDTSLIRNNLNSADPAILKFADLNLDGIVNTQDFSLAIAALEFRSDEQ